MGLEEALSELERAVGFRNVGSIPDATPNAYLLLHRVLQDPRYLDYSRLLPSEACVVDRDAFIVDYCKGKNVLHIGCANAPLTKEKLATGSLLPGKIAKVAMVDDGNSTPIANPSQHTQQVPMEASISDLVERAVNEEGTLLALHHERVALHGTLRELQTKCLRERCHESSPLDQEIRAALGKLGALFTRSGRAGRRR